MTSRFVRSNDAIFSEVGADIVALNISGGFAYGMEKVTADVWRLLERPQDVSSICAQLVADYDVDPTVCRAEVGRLLDQFLKEGLVEAEPPDSPGS